MSVKGEMLNYIVLSMAMGVLCAPIFHYPTPNAHRINRARFNLHQHTPNSTIRRKINAASESIDGKAVGNGGWNYRVIDSIIARRRMSRLEPNFLQQAVEVLNLHSLMNMPISKKNSERRLTVSKSSVSSSIRSPYEEFFNSFVFTGSNVGEFMQHVQTMSAARYRPDEEEWDTDSTKDATVAIDYLNVLKTKRRRKRQWNGRKYGFMSRRRKREEIMFTGSYYPESAEDIVKRVLKQREEQENAEDEAAGRPKRVSFKGKRIALSDFSLKSAILPFLNASRNWLANTPEEIKTNDTAKVFFYNLTALDGLYKLYYACMAEKKKFYMSTLGHPMQNVEHMLVTSFQQITLKCHTW